jgi:lipid A ethanolaminephosphotransferase
VEQVVVAYRLGRAGARENVLDVLKRAGVRVAWRDNNAGCKRVCDRVEYSSVTDVPDPLLCEGGECFDEVLTKGLDAWLPAAGGATLLVMHQKGSHGPAYYLRYPLDHQVFTPDCRVDDVQQCPREHIVNAYDNTILYTDFVLARLIDELGALQDRADTVFLYVSDHGESLGENGVYLHGLPYSLAPVEQVHIPMILWMSPGAAGSLRVDRACVAGRREAPLSHDNLFHSLLGLFGVTTTAYDAQLDLFAPCRKKGSE